MQYLQIEMVDFAPSGRCWWVYEYRAGENGQKITGADAPTGRLLGQYSSLAEAQHAHPRANIHPETQEMLNNM